MGRAILVSAVLLAACSDEPAPIETGANASIEAAHEIIRATESSDPAGAAAAVLALATAGDVLLARPVSVAVPTDLPRPTNSSLTGSVTCTGATCTYDHYGDDTFEVDGTLTVLPERAIFDLDFRVADPDRVVYWLLEGDLTVTPRMIDGWVDNTGFTLRLEEGEDVSERWWGIDTRFVGVTLDDSYCAVAGAFEADVLLGVEGQDLPSYYEIRATFGPGCGDVR